MCSHSSPKVDGHYSIPHPADPNVEWGQPASTTTMRTDPYLIAWNPPTAKPPEGVVGKFYHGQINQTRVIKSPVPPTPPPPATPPLSPLQQQLQQARTQFATEQQNRRAYTMVSPMGPSTSTLDPDLPYAATHCTSPDWAVPTYHDQSDPAKVRFLQRQTQLQNRWVPQSPTGSAIMVRVRVAITVTSISC